MSVVGNGRTRTQIHRRKSSKEEEDDNILIFPSNPTPPPVLKLPLGGKDVNGDESNAKGEDAHSAIASHLIGSDGEGTVLKVNGHTVHDDLALPPPRPRMNSTPSAPSRIQAHFPPSPSVPTHAPSAGPYRTSFSIPRPPTLNAETHALGHSHVSHGSRHQPANMRQSLSIPSHSSHSRARSVSGPYSPMAPSPLAFSFPASQSSPLPIQQQPITSAHRFPIAASPAAPESQSLTELNGRVPSANGSAPQAHTRRHSRLHSRNLSVYFPRPGSLPSTVIDEDGAQEIEFNAVPPPISKSISEDSVLMPSASSPGPGQRAFREGFTFGGRPSTSSHSATPPPMSPMGRSVSSGPLRRGHHHKHSLSHNFFSFLEPGVGDQALHTSETPVPVSPWNPISPFPQSQSESLEKLDPGHDHDHDHSHDHSHGHTHSRTHTHTHTQTRTEVSLGEKSPIGEIRASPHFAASAVIAAGFQFLTGASVWIAGQQIGSLACTGLGYWVVFDAFGVALSRILPNYLARPEMRGGLRRPYGNARTETLATYAQTVYLLFAGVYVCKETFEHFLLSSGGEGHHHHHGDEVTDIFGIAFPPLLLFTTLLSLIGTAVAFDNHSKLVSATGNYIPSLTSLLPSRFRYTTSQYTYPPLLVNLLTNPYALAPVFFCASLLCASALLPKDLHRSFDLFLASIETVVTFAVAYPAAVSLGAVLLQTSPARGLAGGRMEAFLRAMREIERHPQVLHLPAPHIWQLTPTLIPPPESTHPIHSSAAPAFSKLQGAAQSLVVTLELHVRRDLPDDDVLELTRWAWERCNNALHYGMRDGSGGKGEAEVTVGIVRG